MSKVRAPFTPQQVYYLNEFQDAGFMHPFTCRCGANLIATEAGWICNECDYTQDWAHDFMANGNFVDIVGSQHLLPGPRKRYSEIVKSRKDNAKILG